MAQSLSTVADRFESQHPPGRSQADVTPAPGKLVHSLVSASTMHIHSAQMCMQANTHTHIKQN